MATYGQSRPGREDTRENRSQASESGRRYSRRGERKESEMASSSIVTQVTEARTGSTMMAWRVHEFGPPQVMQFEALSRPEPGPGEVVVKVAAAGVGPWDGWIRAGKSALPQPLPLTLGSDLSGEIVAVGPGVVDLCVADQVYGVTNSRFIGAYAEYALATAAMVSRKPA